MKKNILLFLTLFFVIIISIACSNDNTEKRSNDAGEVEMVVSAAASLSDAMNIISDKYKEEHPEVTLNFNYGSSGSLQQQISQGAPVDMFISAADDKFDILIEEGKITEEDSVNLLGNSIVLIVPSNEDSTITNFSDLKNTEVENISIGIPETVPAGKYSRESLENMDVWDEIESKLVYAKDVRQVLSYVETGNVSAGMVYKTDATATENVEIVKEADPTTHGEIVYPLGIISESENYDAAKDFYHFLQSDAALKVFEDYGFNIK